MMNVRWIWKSSYICSMKTSRTAKLKDYTLDLKSAYTRSKLKIDEVDMFNGKNIYSYSTLRTDNTLLSLYLSHPGGTRLCDNIACM